MTYCIETFGCQMNKNDSELMTLSLEREGYSSTGSPETADVIIFNTCSVREHAEERAVQRIRSAKRDAFNNKIITVVTGCMAQRIGKKLINDGIADLVIGPYQGPGIGKILKKFLKDRDQTVPVYTSLESGDFYSRIPPDSHKPADSPPHHRWVTITHGCGNFCTYCIVPYVRGKLISFSSKHILEHIESFSDTEVTEITLLGQNVNQYGTDNGDIPFYKLLEKAASFPGIKRVNFLTSHPKDFSEDIIRVIKDNPSISRSIHLPLQSGSDRVLQLMNRGYTVKKYTSLIETMDQLLPEYSVSTDIIVGFPGETIEDYQQTLWAVEHIRFDDAFTYAYSKRDGTPAAGTRDTISREEKISRLRGLITIQRKISAEKMAARIGLTETAIPERVSKKSELRLMGRTFLNHPVVFPGDRSLIGRALNIKITGVKGSTLDGIAL